MRLLPINVNTFFTLRAFVNCLSSAVSGNVTITWTTSSPSTSTRTRSTSSPPERVQVKSKLVFSMSNTVRFRNPVCLWFIRITRPQLQLQMGLVMWTNFDNSQVSTKSANNEGRVYYRKSTKLKILVYLHLKRNVFLSCCWLSMLQIVTKSLWYGRGKFIRQFWHTYRLFVKPYYDNTSILLRTFLTQDIGYQTRSQCFSESAIPAVGHTQRATIDCERSQIHVMTVKS